MLALSAPVERWPSPGSPAERGAAARGSGDNQRSMLTVLRLSFLVSTVFQHCGARGRLQSDWCKEQSIKLL